MRSAVLCRSLNNSVWFRFDWNVQYYFVSIRKTFIDIFVAPTELRKKIVTHIVPQKNTKNFIFAWKTTQNFLCTKKQRKILLACGLSIRQLSALGCWSVTLLLLWLLLQKKFEYHRTCCDYLLVAACQDCSAWNKRKKLQHFYQLVANMVWELWKSYARTFRCLALLRWQRTSGKGAMWAIVGRIFYCPQLNSKIVGKQQKDHKPRSLNYRFFCKSSGVILHDALPALQRLCAYRPQTVKCECLWTSVRCQVGMFAKQG